MAKILHKVLAHPLLIGLALLLLINYAFFFKEFLSLSLVADTTSYCIPHIQNVISNLKHGIVPFWFPYSVLGLPEFFKSEMSMFYPGTWLIILVDFIIGRAESFAVLGKILQLSQYLHLVVAGLGMYLLLSNKFKLSNFISFIGSAVFAYGVPLTFNMADTSSLYSKVYVPLVIFFTLNFLDKPSFRNYVLFVLIHLLLMSLGYPYIILYILVAELCLSMFYGFKYFISFGLGILNSVFLAGIFLFPALHIYTQTYRTMDGYSQSFGVNPSQLITLFNPIVFNQLLSKLDPSGLFQGWNITWGATLLAPLIYGFRSLKTNKLTLWILCVFIFSLLYSFATYLNVPYLLSSFFPPIEKMRSHPQALILTYFSGTVILSLGLDFASKAIKNSGLITYLWKYWGLLIVILLFVPFYVIKYPENSTGLITSLSRSTVLFGIGLGLLTLFIKTKQKIFLSVLLIVALVELNFYYTSLTYIKGKVKYDQLYARNALVPELPTNDNLFRYEFWDDQFWYNTANLGVFAYSGYEAETTAAYYNAGKFGPFKSLQIANVKYVVTTQAEKNAGNPEFKLIKTINPADYPGQTFLSYTQDDSGAVNQNKTHYIFEVKNYLPRFYAPLRAVSCGSDCHQTENPPELVFVSEPDLDITNPNRDQIGIKVSSYTSNEIKLKITSPGSAFISSSEIWDKGWHIVVNGVPVKLYKVSGSFRGFMVNSGQNSVTLYYQPPGLVVGAFTSLAGVLILYFSYKFRLLSKVL